MRPDQASTRVLIKLYGSMRETTVHFEEESITVRKGNRAIRISNSKFPYLQDMISQFDAYHGAVQADESGLVDYSVPKVHRYRKSGVEFHLPSIAEEEEAIDTYFRWYQPKPGDVVFDLGAHAGVSTYFLSQAVGPTGRVYAFEPDPLAWASLNRNIERLNLSNVHPIQKAVAGERGSLEFQSEGSLGSALSSVAPRKGGTAMLVEAITFTDACALSGVPPRFVKMDIEGAELGVIGAAKEYLRGKQIDFASDTNHLVGGELTSGRLENMFREIGYEARSAEESGFVTTWARGPA
jgi:FkbM family methyltransferase